MAPSAWDSPWWPANWTVVSFGPLQSGHPPSPEGGSRLALWFIGEQLDSPLIYVHPCAASCRAAPWVRWREMTGPAATVPHTARSSGGPEAGDALAPASLAFLEHLLRARCGAGTRRQWLTSEARRSTWPRHDPPFQMQKRKLAQVTHSGGVTWWPPPRALDPSPSVGPRPWVFLDQVPAVSGASMSLPTQGA